MAAGNSWKPYAKLWSRCAVIPPSASSHWSVTCLSCWTDKWSTRQLNRKPHEHGVPNSLTCHTWHVHTDEYEANSGKCWYKCNSKIQQNTTHGCDVTELVKCVTQTFKLCCYSGVLPGLWQHAIVPEDGTMVVSQLAWTGLKGDVSWLQPSLWHHCYPRFLMYLLYVVFFVV